MVLEKIAIVHPSLNKAGGAEILCLKLISQLAEDGYKITLHTIDRVDWELLSKIYGEFTPPDEEFYYFKKLPDFKPEIFNWLILSISYIFLLIRSKKNCLFSWNNYGEVFPFISDISYINSVPLYCFTRKRFNPFGIPFWKFNSKLFVIMFNFLSFLFRKGLIITNSKYTLRLISNFLKHKNKLLIYPPIEVNKKNDIFKKQNYILTVTRINERKNIYIIPRIASKLKRDDILYFIMGSTNLSSLSLISSIKKKYAEIDDKIIFILNPLRSEIFKMMKKSLIYLSTQTTEAFGIAIVEAMSFGCIPIVPRSGGPWYDILCEKEGDVGYTYTSLREAVEKINRIIDNKKENRVTQLNAIHHARKFNEDYFNKRVSYLFNKFYKITRNNI
jgi:glycosyltransferase involved in cell wall biosynthesis